MSWGLIGALVAALAYGAATILQAIGVQSFSRTPATAPLLRRARAGYLYGVGLALDGLGFLASIAALRSMPLFLVESSVASSVAVTALLAVVVLKVRLARREIAAIGVIAVGLCLLAVSAHEGPARVVGATGGWLILAAVVPAFLLFEIGRRAVNRRTSSVVLAAASGFAYGGVGIAARILPTDGPWWHVLARPTLWAIVGHGLIGVIGYAMALDRGRTTTVAAITVAVETIVPAAVGLGLLGDGVRSGLAGVAVLGFVITLGACLALASRAEVTAS